MKLNDLLQILESRLPLEKLSFKNLVIKKNVPVHKMSWAYYLGGIALFFLTVQVVTGFLLLFYYQPTVNDAYASVEFITHHVRGGALIRNMHAWAASGMVVAVLAHLLTTFAMKAFQPPRELNWILGVLLLFLTFGFGFTGYLLPWHQIAVNATKVGLETIEQLGTYLPSALSHLPRLLRETIQGEPAVGQATLSRFFALHVVFLPMGLLGVLGLHLLSVQLHGMSQGVDHPTGREEKFFPIFFIKDLKAWGFVFLILYVLALCLPFEAFLSYPLFEPYHALGSTPQGIKPEWYFFFVYYPMELLPFWLIILLMTGIQIGLLAVPWIFKGTTRKTLQWIAMTAAAYLFIITIFGSKIYEWIKGAP